MPPAEHPTEIERYYTKFFDRREEKPSEDICVLGHSNKVCIITLTADHKALQGGPIQSIEYVVEGGGKKVGDIHGKRKLEAIKLKTGTPLCKITAADGTIYTINSPVRGKLCELNDNIVNDLTLLTRMPGTNGYLAIVLHNTCTESEFCNYLLTQEQYSNGEVISVKKGAQDTDENIAIAETADKTNKEELETVTEADVPVNVAEKKVDQRHANDANGTTDEKGNDTKENDAKEDDEVKEDKASKRKSTSKSRTPSRMPAKRSKR